MKVVKGSFGKEGGSQEPTDTLQEIITMALKEGGLTDTTEAQFILVVDTEERLTFATNEASRGELVLMLETAKNILVNGASE